MLLRDYYRRFFKTEADFEAFKNDLQLIHGVPINEITPAAVIGEIAFKLIERISALEERELAIRLELGL